MLHTDNFIYFFTVCGFFVGLVFSILNFSEPSDILFYSSAITLFFYLFIHIVAINFIDSSKIAKIIFNKKEHEEISEYFIGELDMREKRVDRILLDLENSNQNHRISNKNSITGNINEHKKAA